MAVMIIICPSCKKGSLRLVEGSWGKMGMCAKCGYSGPMKVDK